MKTATEIKVGQVWQNGTLEREIVCLGNGNVCMKYGDGSIGLCANSFLGALIKDEHGNPVDPEQGGERRCLIDWDTSSRYPHYNDGGMTLALAHASTRKDLIAFEAKDGSRCTTGPYWFITDTGRYTTTVYGGVTGPLETVRAKWVIIRED